MDRGDEPSVPWKSLKAEARSPGVGALNSSSAKKEVWEKMVSKAVGA